MNLLDIVIILFVLFSIFQGYRRGILATLFKWAGLVLAIILIGRFSPLVTVGITHKLHLGSFLAAIIAYILIFVLVYLLARLLTFISEMFLKAVKLNTINRILGGVMGLVNSLLVLMILLLILDLLPFTQNLQKKVNQAKMVSATRVLMEDLKVNVLPKIPTSIDRKEKKLV